MPQPGKNNAMKNLFALLTVLSFLGAAPDRAVAAARHLAHGVHDIAYEVRGDGPDTLVFIHGWTGNRHAWRHQLDAFPDYRRIAIDLPGNGDSSRIEDAPYTMEFFADAVRAVLDAERVDRATLFGHSMGFAVAEVFAAQYPARCAAIASIDGARFEVPADPDGQQQWRRDTQAMADAMVVEEARDAFILMLFLPDSPESLKEEILRTSRTVPLTIARAMIAGVAADWAHWLPKRVEIPCLAVYSPAYGLPPDYRENFARSYPLVEYHDVNDVSHFFMLEIPDQLNAIIASFLSRHK